MRPTRAQGARRLPLLFGFLLLARLLIALAPGRPLLLGVPLGLALELLLVGGAAAAFAYAVRVLLPGGDAGDGAQAVRRLHAAVTRRERSG